MSCGESSGPHGIGSAARMTAVRRYEVSMYDSNRWDGFELRDGDIVISTPPKCGTTWTQMICALLIFQTPELPQPLDLVSPWVDMVPRTIEDVRADLDARTHRRFIKSHTPLDGLPWDERVTYITAGRDPRDVAISWDNHFGNMNLEEFFRQRQEAVGLEDLSEFFPDGFPEFPVEAIDRFWQWMGAEPTQGGLVDLVHHLDTFWQRRDEPNVILLHYAELQADLEGEMRKFADRLEIVVEEER